MMRYSLLSLVFITLTNINYALYCPHINKHGDFNITNVMGQWNIHEIISSPNDEPEEPLNCIEDTFNCSNCTAESTLPVEFQIDIFGIVIGSGIVHRNSAKVIANDTENPHTWILDFGTTSIQSELMYRSNQNYNVLLECFILDGSLEFYKALIMSRSKETLSESVVSEIKGNLNEYGIETTNYQVVLHDEISCTPVHL